MNTIDLTQTQREKSNDRPAGFARSERSNHHRSASENKKNSSMIFSAGPLMDTKQMTAERFSFIEALNQLKSREVSPPPSEPMQSIAKRDLDNKEKKLSLSQRLISGLMSGAQVNQRDNLRDVMGTTANMAPPVELPEPDSVQE